MAASIGASSKHSSDHEPRCATRAEDPPRARISADQSRRISRPGSVRAIDPTRTSRLETAIEYRVAIASNVARLWLDMLACRESGTIFYDFVDSRCRSASSSHSAIFSSRKAWRAHPAAVLSQR